MDSRTPEVTNTSVWLTYGIMERKQIGERTAAVLQHKRKNGEKTGGDVPYGYISLSLLWKIRTWRKTTARIVRTSERSSLC